MALLLKLLLLLSAANVGVSGEAGVPALAPMLGHDGRLKGDLTVLNWGDNRWWLMGSYYLRTWHRRWFVLQNSHLSYWKYPDDERSKVSAA